MDLNYTEIKENEAEAYSRHVHIAILFTLSGLAIVGNCVVLAILTRNRSRQKQLTPIDYLLLHLAAADVLVAVFCLFTDGMWKVTYSWLGGDFLCKVVKFMQMLALYASTFVTAAIAVDRCMAIRFPLKRVDHKKLIKRVMSSCWLAATICSLPQLLIFRVLRAPGLSEEDRFEQCVTFGAYTTYWQEPAYILFTFSAMFAVPLMVIFISYFLIVLKLKFASTSTGPNAGLTQPIMQSNRMSSTKSTHTNASLSNSKRQALMRKATMKSLWVSILVILTFLICWLPYYISLLYYIVVEFWLKESSNEALDMFQYIFCFGMTSSVLNPVIYGAFHMSQGIRRQNARLSRGTHNRRMHRHCAEDGDILYRKTLIKKASNDVDDTVVYTSVYQNGLY
ncbi:gonadotropin-releasing hormone receptor-like [Paramacrobiotus metropolitanus]|uniref:gonadotropin-releasing hormone receptor-like n=1 Tax=Paramacrobiotus metropolitanus TaxID=2943436 RepID=UPI002445BE9F|nr:gonadotropin-releasing hormone receptor-like [Paramacrobiotus metropolitanus]